MGILCFSSEASDISIMKTFAIVLSCLVASISADITCDDCLEFGGAMSNYLQSEPTCDECVGSVILVSEVIKSESKIAEIVAFLQGDFCASTGEADCGETISKLMPLAMPVLAGVLSEKSSEYCCTLSPSGVCC